MCSPGVRVCVCLCVIDVNRSQTPHVYRIYQLKASWHVRNPHKKLQKSLQHQTKISSFFCFSTLVLLLFRVLFWGGTMGCFFFFCSIFGYKHWQVWQARRLSTCCTLTNETGEWANWHSLRSPRIDFQVKVTSRGSTDPTATYQKLSAKCARCVCKLNVPNLLLTCK